MRSLFMMVGACFLSVSLLVLGGMPDSALAKDNIVKEDLYEDFDFRGGNRNKEKCPASALNIHRLVETVETLQDRVREMEHELGIQKDIEAIRRLQHIYGYYMSHNLNHRVIDLFSDNAISAEFGGRGVYLGKEGVRTLFGKVHFGEIPDGPRFGLFIMFNQHMDVIDVDPDGLHAKARFRAFLMLSQYSLGASWQAGDYENEYVKEDGKWLFSKFAYKQIFTGGYEDFWENPSWSAEPSELYPPDLPATDYYPFPENWVFPYHFPHPVTGEWIPAFEPTQEFWCGATPCGE